MRKQRELGLKHVSELDCTAPMRHFTPLLRDMHKRKKIGK
jgi:hypothetical protein